MRSMLLAGFVAFTAIAATAVSPAHAQTTGGIVITHGGGNTNVAKGALSEADQSATTLGGTAFGPWSCHHQRRQQPQRRIRPAQLCRTGHHDDRRHGAGTRPGDHQWGAPIATWRRASAAAQRNPP